MHRLPEESTATAAELAAELGAHPDDVRLWAHALAAVHGLERVYCDTMSARVLLAPWTVSTIRREGFLTL